MAYEGAPQQQVSNMSEVGGAVLPPEGVGDPDADTPDEGCAAPGGIGLWLHRGPRQLIAGMVPADFLRRIALIALGSAIFTFGVHNIHNVVGITEGGIIGLMLLCDHWFGLPASVVSPLLDIACYTLGLRILGAAFLRWSVVSSAAIALLYALWERLPHLLPDLSASPLLAALLGGVFVGVGAGIVVRQGGSAGGDDALALSISKLSGWRLARCYLFTDLTVLVLSLSYIPLARIACSLVTVTVSSFLIDVITRASWDRVEQFAEGLRER